MARDGAARVGGLGPAGLFSSLGPVEPLQHFALQTPKVCLDTDLDVGVFAARVDAGAKDGLGIEYIDLLALPTASTENEDEAALILRAAECCEGPVLAADEHPLLEALAKRCGTRLHVVLADSSATVPPEASALSVVDGDLVVRASDGTQVTAGPAAASFDAMVARFAAHQIHGS